MIGADNCRPEGTKHSDPRRPSLHLMKYAKLDDGILMRDIECAPCGLVHCEGQ